MPIFTETYSHLFKADGVPCSTPTHGGACRYVREPGLPWCNTHLCAFFKRLYTRGITTPMLRGLTFPADVNVDAMAEAFDAYVAHVVLYGG